MHMAAKETGITYDRIRRWVAADLLTVQEWMVEGRKRFLLERSEFEDFVQRFRSGLVDVAGTGEAKIADPLEMVTREGWLSISQVGRQLAISARMAAALVDAGILASRNDEGVRNVDPRSVAKLVGELRRFAEPDRFGTGTMLTTGVLTRLTERTDYKTKFVQRVRATLEGRVRCLHLESRSGLAAFALYSADLLTTGEKVKAPQPLLTVAEVCRELRCRPVDERELVAKGFLEEVFPERFGSDHRGGRARTWISRSSVESFSKMWEIGAWMCKGPPSSHFYKKLVREYGEPAYSGRWVKLWPRSTFPPLGVRSGRGAG